MREFNSMSNKTSSKKYLWVECDQWCIRKQMPGCVESDGKGVGSISPITRINSDGTATETTGRLPAFLSGMRPVMYSETDARLCGIGWKRCGFDIAYYENQFRRNSHRNYWTFTSFLERLFSDCDEFWVQIVKRAACTVNSKDTFIFWKELAHFQCSLCITKTLFISRMLFPTQICLLLIQDNVLSLSQLMIKDHDGRYVRRTTISRW